MKIVRALWFVLILASAGPGLAPVSLVGAAPSSTGGFFLPTPDTQGTTDASVAVDGNGGVHTAYLSHSNTSVYYAYCPSACTSAARFTAVIVGDQALSNGFGRLMLDPNGHPRLLYAYLADYSGKYGFRYGECNGGCTTVSNWQWADLGPLATLLSYSRFFALDPVGRPRFVYSDFDLPNDHIGMFYRFCDSNCTTASNWAESRIGTSSDTGSFSLSFNANGQPRLAYEDTYNHLLYYAECNAAYASCAEASNWNSVQLYPLGYYGWWFSVQVAPNGHPRLAYYTGYIGSTSPNFVMHYAWCNTSTCTSAANWDRWNAGWGQYFGLGVDLTFDSSSRPRLAYAVEALASSPNKNSLGYSICTGNCETYNPTWQNLYMDPASSIPPTPIPPGCATTAWYFDRPFTIVLDSAGNPRITYDAYNLAGGGCALYEALRLVRYIEIGATPPAIPPKRLFVPLLLR